MIRNLQFVLSGKDSNASKTFAKVGKSGEGLAERLAKVGAAVPIAGAAVAGVAAAGIKLGSAFIDTSSRLEELREKSKTVFGDQLGLVTKWAKVNAHAMKLTRSEATGLAANFGDLLIPMGFSRKQAAKLSTETLGLSGALAKWSGGTRSAAEVAEILSDAMLGETDSLKGLGINLSAADVQARITAKGQDKLTGAARKQAEALATQALIFENSRDAQTKFAEGGKTLRDRLDAVRLKMREAWEQLVVKLSPAAEAFADWVATKGAAKLQTFIGWLDKNKLAFVGLGVTAIRVFADILRATAGFVNVSTQQFALFLDRAATVARSMGNFGLAKTLRQAAGDMAVAGATGATALLAGATAADALATKLNELTRKSYVVTVDYRNNGMDGSGRTARQIEQQNIARQVPQVMPGGVTGGRRNVTPSLNANLRVDLDGKTIASSNQIITNGRQSRGYLAPAS